MNRELLIIGALLVLAGLTWPWISKIPWGRLPGDFLIERAGFSFYFPLATGLLVSAILTVLLWLFRK